LPILKNNKMNVLIIGSGGRECALAWKLSKSNRLNKLYILPGNGGTVEYGENIDINPFDFEKVIDFIKSNTIELVVVGPEDPLAHGIVDKIYNEIGKENIIVIGPVAVGAKLESSKGYAKQFMKKYNIPTADFICINEKNITEGIEFLKKYEPPYVVKADGLAAGKGVMIHNTFDEAVNEINEYLKGKFGDASKNVVLEQYLKGIELSVFIITDGNTYKILPEAKDYKRIGEDDTGLNTGGMGSVSPVPFADEDFMKKVEEKIIKPTVEGLKMEGIEYIGFIFFGLMNCNGDPYVIEYNVRLGDPETEVILPRIKSDLLDLFIATGRKQLNKFVLEIDERSVATVMIVSGGYPENYEKNKEIKNLDKISDCIVFHAGTRRINDQILTSGGRVLAVTSYGNNLKEALEKCYKNAAIIYFDKMYYRKDIGYDLLKNID